MRYKCNQCGYTSQYFINECPNCYMNHQLTIIEDEEYIKELEEEIMNLKNQIDGKRIRYYKCMICEGIYRGESLPKEHQC